MANATRLGGVVAVRVVRLLLVGDQAVGCGQVGGDVVAEIGHAAFQ
jgi:hypothetical protein